MARQKICYSSYNELAHAWVHGSIDFSGYVSSRRMFAEATNCRAETESSIYSYGRHFCIARKTKDKHGNIVFVINSDTYSSTTTHHQCAIRRAIPEDDIKFYTPEASVNPNKVIKHYLRNIESCIDKAGRSKKFGELLIASAEAYRKQLIDFSQALPMESYNPDDAERIKYEEALVRSLATEEGIAKALKASEERSKVVRAENRIKKAKEIANEQCRIEFWKKGGRHHDAHYDMTVYLRVSSDGNRIETSRHASIEIEKAKELYLLIKRLELRHAFDMYRTKFENDVLTIGCHEIGIIEIDRLAESLGWNNEIGGGADQSVLELMQSFRSIKGL